MATDRHPPHWIDVKRLCHAITERYVDQAARQRVTIDLEVGSDSAVVIGQEDHIAFALDRLARRALAAMPQGGWLTLRVERSSCVTIECIDTGDEQVELDSAVSSVVRAHQGCLWRRRQPGGGTCFIVEMRAAGPKRLRVAA
jgi:signal transduction histidine kinase